MASRRMFAKVVTNSDDFLDLPPMSQLLYFHLSMNADDDGFINNYRSIMRNIDATENDLQALFDNYFAYRFESKVIVMLDWLVNNLIRKNRYVATQFVKELSQLEITDDKRYKVVVNKSLAVHCTAKGRTKDSQSTTVGLPSTVQDSIGKVRLGNVRECPRADTGAHACNIPTIDEVKAFCKENNISIDVECFYNYYASRGWQLNGQPVKSWQALAKCWLAREGQQRSPQGMETANDGWLDVLANIGPGGGEQ